MRRLSGKTAVITGGNSGIGLCTAKTFIDEGARVFIFGRNAEKLARAKETLGKDIFTIQGDVTRADDLARLADTVKAGSGKVDILFVNAGVAEFMPLTVADETHFDRLFDTNVRGAYFTIKALEPRLNDGASIILTTSAANNMGLTGSSVYAASKAALRSFAKTLSAEFIDRKIRVNAISPGPIDTPLYSRMGMTEDEQTDAGKAILARVPVGRMGLPSEIAKSVLFLASDDSSYMAGSEIIVDGGMSQI
ncbi:short-chain dehydrogenase [Algimonas arctica]|uniref:Short-chain dehydrogenase n=1 Tax=Algimonas arctica TaxID=1479486 RepID=A0A8J3CTU9_9PROT|nr:SDR family oxidoreductase [Algimonas arctica]GHB02151.1 short-chain dehydrogenase [Algimonas arctica]